MVLTFKFVDEIQKFKVFWVCGWISPKVRLIQMKAAWTERARVVQKVKSTNQWINLYRVDNTIDFVNSFLLQSDLYDG